jgi:hypothetical protein
MRFDWKLPVSRSSRLACFALVLAAAFALAPVAASAQEAPKIALALTGDTGLIFLYVKSEKTAEFEGMLQKLKEGLAKSEDPAVKNQIAGWKVLKAPNGPAPTGATLYVMLADPAVQNVEYWFLSILYTLYPAEAKALYDQWQDVKHATAQVIWNLSLVLKMQ